MNGELTAVCELSSPLFKKSAPLVVWQYLLNVAVDANGASFSPDLEPARGKKFDIDFDATSLTDYDGSTDN